MMEVYIYGCQCGVNGALIRKLKRYAKENNLEVKVHATKYDKNLLDLHVQYLSEQPTDSYTPIVVYDGTVTRLDQWNF